MIKRLILASVVLAIIGGGLVMFNLFRGRMIETFFANMPEQAMPVTTITVAPLDWEPEIAAIGTARAAQGIELTVEGAGIVRSVEFAANDRVEEGQVLLQLDSKTQEADAEAARTQAKLAEANLQRARQLSARGVTADANLDSVLAAAEAAEAQVAKAEAVLQTRTVVAPFSGVIGLPLVDPGSYISPGTPIATLQDLGRMRVDFSLPEQDLDDVAIGQPLKVALDSDGTSRRFPGEITGIDPQIDSASRMLKLRGRLEVPEGALTPGQFVRVAVALPHEGGVIALPQTAVMSSLYGDFVYVVRERAPTPPPAPRDPTEMDFLDRLVAKVMSGGAGPGGDDADAGAEGAADGAPAAPASPAADGSGPVLEVVQVFVQVGRRSGGLIEVLGDTIAPGDVIVSSGQNRLTSGQQVTIDNSVTPDGAGAETASGGGATGAAGDAAGADATAGAEDSPADKDEVATP